MRRSPSSLVFWIAILMACGGGGVLAYIYSGIYDISATKPHTSLVYWALSTARRQSIRAHAGGDLPPAGMSDPDVAASGLVLYEAHCRQCHGAPGIAPDAIGLGMNPSPPNFAQMSRDLSEPQMYWAISNGIKMTGMPAWEFRLSERERWALVAFLKSSVTLSPAQYQARRDQLASRDPEGSTPHGSEPPWNPEGAADRGRIALQQYACPTCHVIPGVRGGDVQVGPPLKGVAERVYLAGVLVNSQPHMVEWIRHPQAIKPYSAMPDLGVTEREARDMAAYLATLH